MNAKELRDYLKSLKPGILESLQIEILEEEMVDCRIVQTWRPMWSINVEEVGEDPYKDGPELLRKLNHDPKRLVLRIR